MSEPIINRIYDLKIAGFDDSIAKTEALTNAFLKMDEVKRKLNAQLQEKISAGDTDSITSLTAKIKELESQMSKLKVQRDSSAKEQALLAKAEKDRADATLKTQKAEESLAKTEQIRMSTTIAQEKELDRQIALEEKQSQQLTSQKRAIDALEGSYVRLKEQRQQLEAFTSRGDQNSTFNVNGNLIGYDQAIAKIKEIKLQEQQYLDQLKIEKESQASIIKGLQEKVTQIKIERLELEKVVSTSQAGQSVSFKGQTINYADAITQINQLQAAETRLTEDLSIQGAETKSLSNNYYGLLEAQKQAINLYRNVRFDSPIFQEIKQGAIDAAEKVQAFNRSLSPDGTLVGEYKTGIINAFKNLGLTDVLKNQRSQLQAEFDQLKTQNETLVTEYRKAGSAGTTAFKSVEVELTRNIEQQEKIRASLKNLDASLQTTGSIGTQISEGISNGFKNMKAQIGQVLLTYVGFQAVFSGIQQGIGITKELSDQQTNLEIELNKSAGGAKNLVDQLSKLNTRTKLTVLEDIANVAAKAGVSEDKIVGVTAAIDKIKVAFGQDFGDVETGTESLVKLINVFEGTNAVSGDTLLKTGNAIRTLANESVASVPFLNDFSKRMAGLKGIADISLPSVLGLASGFEQFGQTAEVSSTAIVRIIPKLAENSEKYAQIAGLTKQAFSDLLNNNPAEALIKVSEGLVKDKGSLEEFGQEFKNSDLGTGRIASVIGVLGSKADDFRKSMKSATDAYGDTGAITDAFARKNENLASQLDRINKAFSDAANSKAFQATVGAISGLILLLIHNLPALITIIGLYTSGWALANKEMIIARAELIFQRTVLPVLTILFGGQANAMKAYAVASQLAAKGLSLLTTLMRSPIFQIFAPIIGLSLVALKAMGNSVNGVVSALDKQAQKQQFLMEIQGEANKQLSETKAREEVLLGLIKDRTLADQVREKALKDLKEMMGQYGDALTLENVLTDKGTDALKRFNAQLVEEAKNRAAVAIAQREGSKLTQLYQLQSDIETAKKSGGSISTADIPKNVLEDYYTQQGRSASSIGQFIGDKIGIEFTYSGKDLDAFSKLVKREIDAQTSKTSAAELAKIQAEGKKKIEDAAGKTTVKIKPVEIDIANLKDQIKSYDDQIELFKGSQKELSKLIAERKKLQDQLDAALGKEKTHSSRLSGTEKDIFKDIDAKRDQEVTAQKLKYKELQIDEETYLQNVLKINTDAANKKIASLKGTDAEERKQIAQQKLFKIEQEEETNKKLFDLQKKQLDANLASVNNQANISLAKITDDPTKTDQEKRKAKADFLVQEYLVELSYNNQVDILEKKYNQRSVENAQKRKDALLEIAHDYNKTNEEITVGALQDIDDATSKAVAKIKLKYDQLKEAILHSKGSSEKKNSALSALDQTENIEIGGANLEGLNKKIEAALELYNKGKITLQDYEKIYSDLVSAQQKLNDEIGAGEIKISDTKSLVENRIRSLFNFDKILPTDDLQTIQKKLNLQKVFADTVTQSFQTAGNAMNNYFDAEENRINRSNQIVQKRLDIELKQAKDRAQSQAEQDSLDRQFQAKKEAADRKAFEQNKKLQIEQAKINLAIQLSNLAVIAFAPNPLNIATLGIAGTIMYAVQAALAIVNYASNVQKIKSAQFAAAGGGKIPKLSAGRITHPSNIPTQPNGDDILATVKTDEVILNKKQQREAGGEEFFRRLGVPGFADGGRIRAFASGGYTGIGTEELGGSLKAPVNPQSYLSGGRGNSDLLEENSRQIATLTGLIAETGRQVHQRIDKLEVVLDPGKVERANNKTKKATSIGNL